MRMVLSALRDEVPNSFSTNKVSERTLRQHIFRLQSKNFLGESSIFLHCSYPRISKGSLHPLNKCLAMDLAFCLNIVVQTRILDMIAETLSEEFTQILPSKFRLGSNDRGVSVTENFLFDSVGPKFVRIRFHRTLTKHLVQIKDNVKPLLVRWRH